MHKVFRLVLLVLAAVLAFAPAVNIPAQAQANKGGFIIDSTFGKGPETFNPIFCNDATCATDISRIMPNLVGQSPQTLLYTKGEPGTLAKDWKRSDDGLTWTLTLRNDWKWTDGSPITAQDVLYSWKAINDPSVESPSSTIKEDVDSVTAPDDYTLVIKLKRPECTSAYQKINSVYGTGGVAPAKALGDVAKLKESDFNLNPSVGAGQYKFDEFRTGEQLRLLSDQNYPDKKGPKIQHDGFIEKVVENQTVQVEQFLAGQINVIAEPPVSRRKDIFDAEKKGDLKTFSAPGTLWDHIVLNLADPTNPQSAFEQDKDGNPIKDKPITQKPHPIFGDVRVRKAFQLGINVPDIIKGAVFGYGQQMTSLLTPGNIYNDKNLKPVAYDPAAAGKLLDEAGWPMGPDGFRVAKGSKTAPDGTRLAFKLLTIQGNVRRTAVATVVKDELKQVGFDVDVQTLDFNKMIDELQAQTFDAVVSARGSAYDDSIDWTFLYDPATDVPKTGSNNGSYVNPKLTDLMQQAASVPGCDTKKTTDLYSQIEKILQDDQPYIWLYSQDYLYAWRNNVEGVKPFDLSVGYTDQWKVNPN